MKKLTYEFVKEQFELEGYKLLSKKYVSCSTKLDYRCPEGHKHSICWSAFQQGHGCFYCQYENMKGKNNFMYGRKHTEEIRKKMSEARKGKYVGENNPFYGKTHSDESKIKISENHADISGENNPNWKGGISPERQKDAATSEYKLWRNQVFERDEFTCRTCDDNKGGNLQAHHILPWGKFNGLIKYNTSNGITLCKTCHMFFKGKEVAYANVLIKKHGIRN